MRRRPAPFIGITADLTDAKHQERHTSSEPTLFLPRRYSKAVELAGGVPVILTPTSSAGALEALVDRLDGLLISGGDFDIHPRFYGEKPIQGLGKIKPERTQFEFDLTGAALRRNLPVLGICGGAQAINVALGGSLYQDIASQRPDAGEHQQSSKKEIGGHRIQIQPGTRLQKIVKQRVLEVNTTHHQAIKRLGNGLVVNAIAEDGLIEGVESSFDSFILGLQWHPEVLATKNRCQRRIFSAFVEVCKHLGRWA
jgi:putative glutamine amidotransferase